MKTARVILVGVILAALMVPLAQGIDFLGLVNYIPGRGGTVNFAQNFTATTLQPWGSLWRWTNVTWLGLSLGVFSVDASAGSTVLVTGLNWNTVAYTVTGAGTQRQYIYHRGLPASTATVTGGAGAPYTKYILGVRTTGNSTVTVTYGAVTGLTDISLDILISFFPLVMLIAGLEARRRGFIQNRGLALMLLVCVLGVLLWALRAAGFY